MTRFQALLAASLMAATAMSALPGCGSASLALSEEVTVKGKVILDRKPLTEGTVFFTPHDIGNTPREASIAKDGTYTVKTLSGFNTIKVDGPAVKKNPKLADYLFSFEVQPGENSFDLVMDSKGPW